MDAYEYKILSVSVENGTDWSKGETELNRFVSDGWEIHSTHPALQGAILVFGSGLIAPALTFVLRKKKT